MHSGDFELMRGFSHCRVTSIISCPRIEGSTGMGQSIKLITVSTLRMNCCLNIVKVIVLVSSPLFGLGQGSLNVWHVIKDIKAVAVKVILKCNKPVVTAERPTAQWLRNNAIWNYSNLMKTPLQGFLHLLACNTNVHMYCHVWCTHQVCSTLGLDKHLIRCHQKSISPIVH